VTKLLAADSFLGTYCREDPEAESAFITLTSLLTNPTKRSFFNRAHLIEQQLGPVGRCWKFEAASAQPRASQPIAMNRERAWSFARIFRADEAKRAASWLCFQSSNELMRVFWQDNKEDDVKETYDALGAANVNLLDLHSAIYEAKRDFGLQLQDISCRVAAALEKPLRYAWDDQSLAVAYLAWAYIKGFRYVTGLDPKDIYAVHFTREHAVDTRSGWATQIGSARLRLFPWGELLAPYRDEGLKMQYPGVVLALRAYTRANLEAYLGILDSLRPYFDSRHSHDARRAFSRAMSTTTEFALNGLTQALPSAPPIAERKLLDKAILCWHAVSLISLLQFPADGGLHALPEFYIDIVSLPMSREAKETIADYIHLLKTRWDLRAALSKKREILESFLHLHGIDRGLW